MRCGGRTPHRVPLSERGPDRSPEPRGQQPPGCRRARPEGGGLARDRGRGRPKAPRGKAGAAGPASCGRGPGLSVRARHGTDGSHTETSKLMQEARGPGLAPASPRPLLSADRKTDKKGSRPVMPCMFRVCYVWSRTGRGWRAGLRGRRGRRGARRIPAPPGWYLVPAAAGR